MRRAACFLVGLVVVSAALAAAGCGGGGGGGGGKRLSKSEFISKADAVCGAAIARVSEPPADIARVDPTAPGTTDEQMDEFGDYVEGIVKILRGEAGDLRDLKPPADFQDRYDKALALLDESLNELDEAVDAAHAHDKAKLKAKIQESDKHSTEADGIVRGYGLKVCGSNS